MIAILVIPSADSSGRQLDSFCCELSRQPGLEHLEGRHQCKTSSAGLQQTSRHQVLDNIQGRPYLYHSQWTSKLQVVQHPHGRHQQTKKTLLPLKLIFSPSILFKFCVVYILESTLRIGCIFVKDDEQIYNISAKFLFELNLRFHILFDLRQILLITFDFSIKPASICLLKPQDKQKKFTNFVDVESFLVGVGGGGGGKYAKTWSLPKAILSGRWVITTHQQQTRYPDQPSTPHSTVHYMHRRISSSKIVL